MKFLFLLTLAACATSMTKEPATNIESKHTEKQKVFTFTPQPGCGQKGTIKERIEDCDKEADNFVLVMKSGKDEVYQDTKTGDLWGPRLRYETNFYGAGKVCSEMELPNLDGHIRWRLPSITEHEEAHRHGIDKAFNDMDHWFWSSTFRGRKLRKHTPIQMWRGMDGEVGQNTDQEAASVRCIGHLQKV